MKELKLLSLVLVAGTATMFTACTSESDNSPSAKISYESVAAAQQVPVTFGTYLGEQAITRGGTAGNIVDVEDLATNKDGFGVFAYYTYLGDAVDAASGKNLSGTYNADTYPNFMYNQHVEGTHVPTPVWSYSPLKYWPNDFAAGNVDGQSPAASGSKISGISFFAYAPYTSTFSGTGITGKTANNATGDPKISYTLATTPDGAVDLLWGVAGSSDNHTAGSAQSVTAGKPLVNQKKQELDGKVSFKFNHALARLGLTVQASKDIVGAGNDGTELWVTGGSSPNKTRIYVDEVTLKAAFNTSGDLNLNNTTVDEALWENVNSTSNTVLTVSGANLNGNLKYESGLAGDLHDASQKPGVISASSTVLMNDGTSDLYFMMIPSATPILNIDVKITYRVMTEDNNLNGGKSVVENVITKRISSLTFTGGKAYTLNLVLGMTSVELNATVSPWVDYTPALDPVHLPLNVS